MRTIPKATLAEGRDPAEMAPLQRHRELAAYAVMAPSTHNSQPWGFRVDAEEVRVYLDTDRWLRVADPDRRELHVSIGCALENLVVAARHFGLEPELTLFPEGADADLVGRVRFGPQRADRDLASAALFWAIARRHTNHRPYDGQRLAEEQAAALEAVADDPVIQVHLSADAEIRERVDELVARADALQFADPAWREELGYWLGTGAFGTGWLTSKMAQLAVTYLNMGATTARKDVGLLRSASALGLVTATRVDPEARVRAGRVFERLWLLATDLGLQVQPMNQVLQVPETLAQLEAMLPAGWGAPQVAFRIGYGEPEPEPSPRRPLEEVIELVDGND